jgi:hypothetical protein
MYTTKTYDVQYRIFYFQVECDVRKPQYTNILLSAQLTRSPNSSCSRMRVASCRGLLLQVGPPGVHSLRSLRHSADPAHRGESLGKTVKYICKYY